MRAALMWPINDFPTYGMLFGWSTHRKIACPIFMEDIKTFTLKFGEKASSFDSHRRFLHYDHPLRRNKNAFVKSIAEIHGPPIRLTFELVYNQVKDILKVEVIVGVVLKSHGYGQFLSWTKQCFLLEK